MTLSRLRSKKILMALALAVLCLAVVTGVTAAVNDAYSVNWNVVAGGGGSRSTSPDGRFSLSGTIGQPDAYTTMSSSTGDNLTGGFWVGMPAAQLFLPLVTR